jgi:hypothetical protein
MEHTIIIWSNLKERGEDGSLRHAIEDRIKLTEDELLEIVLEKWESEHEFSIQEDRKYKAELEETKH